ncbi:hypothetical protein HYPSUDRAFT_289734 [Hypholoma sublateritium FD-334 SS-4]|uniref:Uncharacterized protein n=1 Tax=Hypholoma sublateritium (strain FD-334 SS-4) TaxID=945553 RepID=A0A0D2NBN3_HYPSF|nr:hypothetical protein HYPSUDRAFT_289734 [Hypholoma sublateritium FD-334 SS-4]
MSRCSARSSVPKSRVRAHIFAPPVLVLGVVSFIGFNVGDITILVHNRKDFDGSSVRYLALIFRPAVRLCAVCSGRSLRV